MGNNQIGYDEDQAVKFIRNYLPEQTRIKYTNDEILFVVDCIWDYYEDHGLLDLSNIDTEEEEINIDDVSAYVKKALKKDGEILMDPADVKLVIEGELAYEESIEAFDA